MKFFALITALAAATAPDVSEEVARERNHDINIHDQFAAQQKDDEVAQKKVEARVGRAFLQGNNEDAFDAFLKKYESENHVEAPPKHANTYTESFNAPSTGHIVTVPLTAQIQKGYSLVQLKQKAHAKTKVAPNVEEAVRAESNTDVYIHDEWVNREKADEHKRVKIEADHNLKA